MKTRAEHLELARKFYRLTIDRGAYEGERQTAQAMLDRLMAQQGISLVEVTGVQPRETYGWSNFRQGYQAYAQTAQDEWEVFDKRTLVHRESGAVRVKAYEGVYAECIQNRVRLGGPQWSMGDVTIGELKALTDDDLWDIKAAFTAGDILVGLKYGTVIARKPTDESKPRWFHVDPLHYRALHGRNFEDVCAIGLAMLAAAETAAAIGRMQ